MHWFDTKDRNMIVFQWIPNLFLDSMVKNMNRAEMIQDFKEYFKENQEDFLNRAVNIEDLPADDDWVLDDEWDEVYDREVLNKRDGHV